MAMKLLLQRETLLTPLQMVIGVVERKQALPILSNVLLTASDQQLSITGTDLEVELIGQISLPEPTAETYKLTLPGRKLVDICRALPENAPIEITKDKDRIVLRSGRSRFTLASLPAEDFPSIEPHATNIEFTIPQKSLLFLLQRTHFAMAQQDVRYYLNGMLLETSLNTLRSVATDGHRLAINAIQATIAEENRIQVIVPRKGIMELMRLLEDTEDEVKITIGNNHIRVSNNQFTFTSKLIDGRFPDYQRVIPQNSDKSITINRETLKQSLSRAAILCNEKFRGIRFEFRKNVLRMFANNPEQEVAEEELRVDYDDTHLDIGFNVNYFLDVLNTIKSDEIKLIFADTDSSMLIEEPDSDVDSTFVIMPMRL